MKIQSNFRSMTVSSPGSAASYAMVPGRLYYLARRDTFCVEREDTLETSKSRTFLWQILANVPGGSEAAAFYYAVNQGRLCLNYRDKNKPTDLKRDIIDLARISGQ